MKITIHTGDPERLDKLDVFLKYPELEARHPKLQVEWAEYLIANKEKLPEYYSTIITNSDHIINRFRVAKKNKEIDDFIIVFYPFDSDGEPIVIEVDENGRIIPT